MSFVQRHPSTLLIPVKPCTCASMWLSVISGIRFILYYMQCHTYQIHLKTTKLNALYITLSLRQFKIYNILIRAGKNVCHFKELFFRYIIIVVNMRTTKNINNYYISIT